jgi:hypothetical protein
MRRRGDRKSATGYGPETAFVQFDRPRVLRVLARIAADLDELAGRPTKPVADDPVDARLSLEFGTVAG